MITVISGTNRPNSRTKLVAKHCFDVLNTNGKKVEWIDLVDFQNDIISSEMYESHYQNGAIEKIRQEIIGPSKAILIIAPEYNGSYPGLLKSFIDVLSVKDHIATFSGKRAGLIGTSTGRAGNLRGLEHLTGILNYLNILVMPNKLPVSSIQTLIEGGELLDDLKLVLNDYLKDFLTFTR